MEEDEFYLKIAHALSGCQLIEQKLKLYIAEVLELISKCVDGRVPFHMKGEDYSDSSLERLIQTFKKLSDNKKLGKELDSFKNERNFLSHIGITHCLDYEGELHSGAASKLDERINNIKSEAVRLQIEIHEELNKFRAHLLFWGVNENS
jgi:hypothetical protein